MKTKIFIIFIFTFLSGTLSSQLIKEIDWVYKDILRNRKEVMFYRNLINNDSRLFGSNNLEDIKKLLRIRLDLYDTAKVYYYNINEFNRSEIDILNIVKSQTKKIFEKQKQQLLANMSKKGISYDCQKKQENLISHIELHYDSINTLLNKAFQVNETQVHIAKMCIEIIDIHKYRNKKLGELELEIKQLLEENEALNYPFDKYKENENRLKFQDDNELKEYRIGIISLIRSKIKPIKKVTVKEIIK
ncbi:hypothetical protein [Parabacteroides sp. FAFU027]|uniref:hypothetical protein n=1 Tax=Parabacteroides sp. FAFU027 TaxID=2922715 RepID=UPI001FAE9F1D|nr:hypothetical protein [Parabacteroides sp. FAFU027]